MVDQQDDFCIFCIFPQMASIFYFIGNWKKWNFVIFISTSTKYMKTQEWFALTCLIALKSFLLLILHGFYLSHLLSACYTKKDYTTPSRDLGDQTQKNANIQKLKRKKRMDIYDQASQERTFIALVFKHVSLSHSWQSITDFERDITWCEINSKLGRWGEWW